jgi:hypothetical protein
MSDKEPTDSFQEVHREKVEQLTAVRNGITIATLIGKVSARQELLDEYAEVLREHGILQEPEKYLVRNVRKSLLGTLLRNGCERNEKSYRDKVFESDFSLSPDDYTYCHGFNGNGSDFLRHATYNPDGMVAVFYKADEMIPHHEEKYDKASSLGLGPTKVTYSFKDLENKTKAIALVIQSQLRGVEDLWQDVGGK